MATLLALNPPGLTFQDLVGPTMTKPLSDQACRAEQGESSTAESVGSDRAMRIYLPHGEVKSMRLTEYQEFLQSYRFEDVSLEEFSNDTRVHGGAWSVAESSAY